MIIYIGSISLYMFWLFFQVFDFRKMKKGMFSNHVSRRDLFLYGGQKR